MAEERNSNKKNLNKENVLQLVRDNYLPLTTKYGVARIGFFGSFVKGTMTEDSDLDIVVEFNRPIGFKFFQLTQFLEDLFGKKVDVITTDGIENIRVKGVAQNIKRDIVYV